MDSLVTPTTTASTSSFNEPLWEQFSCYGVAILHEHILPGIDIQGIKNLYDKGDFQKTVQEDIFVALSQETATSI